MLWYTYRMRAKTSTLHSSLWAWTSFHDFPVSSAFRIWRRIPDSSLYFCCPLVTTFVCLDLRTDRSNLRFESYRVEDSRHQNGWPVEVIWCCFLIELYKTKTDMLETNHNGMLHLFWMLRLRESKGGTIGDAVMHTFENQVSMAALTIDKCSLVPLDASIWSPRKPPQNHLKQFLLMFLGFFDKKNLTEQWKGVQVL